MYVYMYVCMYVCIYVCMYVRMYVYMYVCMYVYMYLCMYVYMYVCTYVCMYVCMYGREAKLLILSLVPRPPLFCVLQFAFSIYTEVEECEKRKRPGLIHHMRMTSVRGMINRKYV